MENWPSANQDDKRKKPNELKAENKTQQSSKPM
jgi:hypothetical protein